VEAPSTSHSHIVVLLLISIFLGTSSRILLHHLLDEALSLEVLVCLLVEHVSFAVLELFDLVLLGTLRLGPLDLLPYYIAW